MWPILLHACRSEAMDIGVVQNDCIRHRPISAGASRLHGEGADDHLAAAEAQRAVRLRALACAAGRERVLAAHAVAEHELRQQQRAS